MPEEKKKRRKQVPIPDMAPPTLGEYLSHLFDNNALYTIEPAALTDAQFFWLLSDLGLGLSSDEITVLCRRAPQSNGKVDWSTFAPRCEELLLQTFRTREDSEIGDLGELEARLEREEFDLVAVGRALLADPHWAAKVREGRFADLAPFSASSLATLT